jgi:hypothetical protein
MLGQGAVALKVKRERAHARERASERFSDSGFQVRESRMDGMRV